MVFDRFRAPSAARGYPLSMGRRPWRSVRGGALIGTAALSCALLAGGLVPGQANAMYSSCRSDPKVQLSDGSIVTLTAEIGADTSNVRNVEYTLHAPAGTRVTNVIYTGGALQDKESLQVVADNLPGTYDADTLVNTTSSQIAVTATAQVVTSVTVIAGSISGYSNQPLHVRPTAHSHGGKPQSKSSR